MTTRPLPKKINYLRIDLDGADTLTRSGAARNADEPENTALWAKKRPHIGGREFNREVQSEKLRGYRVPESLSNLICEY